MNGRCLDCVLSATAMVAVLAGLVSVDVLAPQPSHASEPTSKPSGENERMRYLRRLRHKPVVTGFSRSRDKLVVVGERFAADTTITVDGEALKVTITASRIVGELGHRVGKIVVKTAGEEHFVDSLAIEDPNRSPPSSRESELAAARRRIAERRKANPPIRDRAQAHRNWLNEQRRTRTTRMLETERVLREFHDETFLASWATQRELALHMERRAKLVWILALARKNGAEDVLVRANAALDNEGTRHVARMDVLAWAHRTDHANGKSGGEDGK